MIEIKNVTKSYGKKKILENFSIEVSEGKIVGILGANGSGKSTLLSGLYGILPFEDGVFKVDGIDLLKNRKLIQQKIGYVPQGIPLIEELSAKDNLKFWYSKDKMEQSLKDGSLKMLGINEFLDVCVNKMSGGMKKRLSIGCSLFNSPKILLLDEPTASLDILCKQKIYEYLEDFKRTGGTAFVVTHEQQEIELADVCFILKEGKAVEYKFNGDMKDLSQKIWS